MSRNVKPVETHRGITLGDVISRILIFGGCIVGVFAAVALVIFGLQAVLAGLVVIAGLF